MATTCTRPPSTRRHRTNTPPADQLFAIAILIDELKHEEVAHRVSSMQHLKQIADALGPERTQQELLPYLVDSCLDDEDEVLLVMAEQLAGFVKQVGGAQNAHVLISPLEALANVEEPAVREKAVKGLIAVSQDMSNEQVHQYFFGLVKQLAKKDWFTSRITAAGLVPMVYSRSSSAGKPELKQVFVDLSKDDTPMVRKSLASNMPKMVEVCDEQVVKQDLVSLFSSLAVDEHDSVRLLACPIGIAICKKLGPGNASQVSAQCCQLAGDKSWRVRWSVAQVFDSLLASAAPADQLSLLQSFIALLKDVEAEVRTAATTNLTRTAKVCSPEHCQLLLPLLQELSQDQSEHVREALALVVLGLAPIVGKEDTMHKLLPTFLLLLRDPHAAVRLGMVSELGAMENVISIDALSTALLPAVVELAQDKNWRVRAQTIAHLPVLAKQMEIDYFEKNLLEICIGFLSDQVFSVREAGAGLVMQICQVFGQMWTLEKIVPRVQALKQTSNYLFRLTAVRTMEVLMLAVDDQVVRTVLVPFILSLATDPVPNVRFGVAKALKRTKLGDNAQVRECLQQLAKDKDADVVYFANAALLAV